MNAYNITAPEEIAKKYGGNKRKIQQAAAQGLINPTEAVMAGMFIDRMRNAAAQEQAQQPTVAEQVMNPQPQPQMPPQGMAAAPQTRQMPQQAQMGQPSQQAMMAARGGMLTIPYNEGDYAEGGIVGFAPGGGYGEAMSQLRRQLGAARTQAQRDQITAAMNQLRAQQEGSTYQPSLAAADLSTPAMDTETGFSGAVESPRIDPNRFNTGTYTGAETRYMGKGDDVIDNVQRGIGLFGDFVSRNLPSFGSDDPEQFARVKNAQPSEVPGEEARQARVAAMTGRQPAGVEAIASPEDLLNVGMETFADSQQVTTPTEQTAPMRSQQIPTSLGDRVGRGGDPRLFGENERPVPRGRSGLGAIGSVTAQDQLAMLGEEVDKTKLPDFGTGRSKIDPTPFYQQETVADQVQQTKQAVTTPAPEPTVEPPKETDQEYIDRQRALFGEQEDGDLTKELKAQIANRAKTMEGNKKDAMWMAVLETGVGMLAQGGGQTALQALGKAGGPALKNYAGALKDIKKEDIDLLKLGVSMEAADKKTKAAIDQALISNLGKKEAAEISAAASERIARIQNEKKAADTIELESRAAAIAQELEAANKPVPAQNILMGLAAREKSQQAIEASLAATGVRAAGQSVDARTEAINIVNSRLTDFTSPEYKKMIELNKQDPQAAARYRQELIDAQLGFLTGSNAQTSGNNYQFSTPGAQSAYTQYSN